MHWWPEWLVQACQGCPGKSPLMIIVVVALCGVVGLDWGSTWWHHTGKHGSSAPHQRIAQPTSWPHVASPTWSSTEEVARPATKRFHPSDWRALEACCWPWTWWCINATALASYANLMMLMMMMIGLSTLAGLVWSFEVFCNVLCEMLLQTWLPVSRPRLWRDIIAGRPAEEADTATTPRLHQSGRGDCCLCPRCCTVNFCNVSSLFFC